MLKIFDQEVVDQNICIDDEKSFSVIGKHAVLRGCTIDCRVPARAVSFDGARLEDCRVIAKKTLKGFSWLRTRLIDTTFEGNFTENEFGHLESEGPNGHIEACSFASANVDGCQFFGCDVDSLVLPGWPYLTIKNPFHEADAMASLATMSDLRVICKSFRYCDSNAVAMVNSASTLESEFGIPIEDLKTFFRQFDHVLL
ncbi:hypothetical protein [Stieleria varia]|uniref:Pentapeptide repeats (8 copies) n=1 Tax=Stieleria varia TaxID=2528005 RepID=A0A5C6A5G4_9BACT|nr:hypothetical protein [Stieleria varia]TWT94620.1 hypothetical protein Pla52n_54410 [Stieleria varia]